MTVNSLFKNDKGEKGVRNNLVIVGPITEEAKAASGNDTNMITNTVKCFVDFKSSCSLPWIAIILPMTYLACEM